MSTATAAPAGDDDRHAELMERVRELLHRVSELEVLASILKDPHGRVFLARTPTDDDGPNVPATGFVEQTVNKGVVEDYPDGRKSLKEDDASNLVEPGGAFVVIEVPDIDDDGNHVTRFVPVRSSNVVEVMITGNAPGGGKYYGKIVTGSIAPANATTWLAAGLALPEEGQSLPQDEDCVVINGHEDGETTHVLTSGTGDAKRNHFGLKCGVMPAPDGRAIVRVNDYSFFTGAP